MENDVMTGFEMQNPNSVDKTETMMNSVLSLKSEIDRLETAIEEGKKLLSKELKSYLETGKQASFEYKGKYYSIRSRSGNYFICESNVPFGSWHKKGSK